MASEASPTPSPASSATEAPARPGSSRSLRLTIAVVGFAVGVGGILLVRGRSTPASERPAPEKELSALLVERAARVDPSRLPFAVNDRRAEVFAAQVREMPAIPERLPVRLNYASELLNAGRIEESLQELEAIKAEALEFGPEVWESGRKLVLSVKAMAYMRMAEEQNCCRRNNRDSCLLPIKGQGVHTKREGATQAIAVLGELLSLEPEDLRARWLLNVAYMTLGRYPQDVPKRHLIPPKIFESEYPLPAFDNVAKEAGVGMLALAGGVALEDFDGDQRLDLVVSHMGFEDQTRIYRNSGDGTFEDRTRESGLLGQLGGLNMNHADYDNDGDVDVMILRGGWMGPDGKFPLSLLQNQGNGTFRDVTIAAGMLRFAPTQTAAWLDFDGDGWLDVFVGNESVPDEEAFPCHLFRNNHDGTFTDVAPDVGIAAVAFVKGATAGDFNNDGRPDLYLSVQMGNNILFRNDGPTGENGRWLFTDVADKAGVRAPRNSFGTFFFDYDNDGWQDLFVTGYDFQSSVAADVTADRLGRPTTAERCRLYRNRGDGTFEDVTRAAGLFKVVPAMGLNYGDLDNDGFIDIYEGTGSPDLSSIVGSRMFRNDGGRRFQDVTTAGNFGHLQKGHAIAFGDIDNDGDQDVYAQMGAAFTSDKAYSALYKNPGNGNRRIVLDLRGVRVNRRAVGARIKVTVDTPKGPRTLYRVVSSGATFGANPHRQEVGLGDAQSIRSVEIFWPASGLTQSVPGLELGGVYQITEGSEAAVAIALPRVDLPGSSAPETKAQVLNIL
jgi:hypothetical protein